MGWLPVLMGVAASVIFYGLAQMAWLTASASATIGGFWSGSDARLCDGRREKEAGSRRGGPAAPAKGTW
jgi:hypothetical protein